MNPDERLRAAFRDLSERAARDVNPSLGRPTVDPMTQLDHRRARGPRRPVLAIAAAAVVTAGAVAAIGLTRGDDGTGLETGPAETSTDDTSNRGSDGSPATTADPATTGTADGAPPTGDGEVSPRERRRVATALVVADTDDPFLNVRLDPEPGADLLAKLPATYTGLIATGQTETAADGGRWIEVELVHPVAVTTVERDTGRPPSGWVNAAFTEPLPESLPVTLAEVPACAGGFEPIETGAGLADGHVYGLDAGRVTDDCLRVVVTFGAGRAPFEWYELPGSIGPAAGLPDVVVTMSGGQGASLDLGAVSSAWPTATDDEQVYVVRSVDRSLDLVTPRHVDGVTVTGLPDRGVAVIDLELGDGSPPPSGAGVVLTSPVTTGAGSVAVRGIARPFEATLGVSIEDPSGAAVEAVYSGSDFLGTAATTEYGVGTTDWAEAWGTFAVRADGLAAGRYTLVLTAQGGADDPDTLRVPFTIDDDPDGDASVPALPSATDQAAAQALVDFARGGSGGSIDGVPLADDVTLLLGAEPYATASPGQLAEREAWTADAESGFGGFAGPFNPLDQLEQPNLRFTTGPIPHCAGPPVAWPAELDGLRQVNVEPVGIDSCIAWFGVHLFLDDDDRIAAVALDLFGP